jgi:hypothetical protein
VADAVVRALDARDRAALARLALDEAEFRALVWPRLPASRKERNLPVDFVWSDLAGKSQAHLSALLATWEPVGRPVRIDFAGGTTDYGTFRVHRRAVVTLRDGRGRETTGRIFGSVLEKDGRFKVFSYVTD